MLLPAEEGDDHTEARGDHPGHDRNAERGDGLAVDLRSAVRLHEPPLADLEDAEDDQAEPGHRQRDAELVDLRTALRGRVHDHADEEQQDQHHERLAGEHDAPAEVFGREAAEQRPECGARRRYPAEDPVGDGAIASLVVAGGERRDGRNHECRAEALDQRPADQQHREVLRERRDQRADAVDDHADREGAPAAPDVTQLAAGEHEGGHRQRVTGDRRLEVVDRRVEVRRDLGQRHVHDGRVEDHHELRRAQRNDGGPLAQGAQR